MNLEKVLISFSGGRTSGYMTHRMLEEYADRYEFVVVFANTGEEDERTLQFVNECDRVFGFGTVWIEAVTHPSERRSSTHKIVSFETATRPNAKGGPFERMVAKYGISNRTAPHCTRELKRRPIESFARSIGWRDYKVALGFRTDEARRAKAGSRPVVYPLIDWFPSDKQDVNSWWEEQPFNLQLREHEGNCRWCWKKSFTKHAKLMRENPSIYDFPERIEDVYGNVGAVAKKVGRPQVFFREQTSTKTLRLRVLGLPVPSMPEQNEDENYGCSESCELFETEIIQ